MTWTEEHDVAENLNKVEGLRYVSVDQRAVRDRFLKLERGSGNRQGKN